MKDDELVLALAEETQLPPEKIKLLLDVLAKLGFQPPPDMVQEPTAASGATRLRPRVTEAAVTAVAKATGHSPDFVRRAR